MTDLLSGLNEAQREAVTSTEGYIRVIAGAGSGKTRALTHRFAYLVNEAGILPGSILCVTFTNKAAEEMRQRIHRLTGDNDTGYICTFHSFCVSVLQEDSSAVGYPKQFLVLDNADINDMLALIYEERGLSLRDMTFGKARDMIEILKTKERPDYYLDMIRLDLDTLKDRYQRAVSPKDIIFYGYLYQEKKCFGLDYNDLILFSLYLFDQRPDLARKWQQRLEYIMIDEFQDIDELQERLMKALCPYHNNLFIVGDPDQTVYTWRGASVRFLLDFEEKFPHVKTIMMTENYRSSPQILAVVNSLIDKNKARLKKDLLPTRPDGAMVHSHHAKNSEQEAAWIAHEMQTLHDEQGVPYGDMAILYRARYVTRMLEAQLAKAKVPFHIYSGVGFYSRKEVKDALSYLRLIVSRDDLSFRRVCNVPKRNLGKRRMAFLEEYAIGHGCSLFEALQDNLEDPLFRGTQAESFVDLVLRFSQMIEGRSVSEVLSEILDKSGYETALRTEGSQERLDNLAELKQAVYLFETSCGEEVSVEHYLAHAALFTAGDEDSPEGRVKLMTVHAAKGLEFPVVFLCGMNEGIFPSRKTVTLPGMEEERRLAFVAMTRARDRLYLSEAEGRNLDGSPRYPSRFLLDIDPALLEADEAPPQDLLQDARDYIDASSRNLPEEIHRFSPGDRVRHFAFGEGTVQDVDEEKGAAIVLFDGMKTPRAISFKAKMETI